MTWVTVTNKGKKWEYGDTLKIGNGQPVCFEIMKTNRYILHCKNP